MKVGTALAIAQACGVRLEWLLLGRRPMREESGKPSAEDAVALQTSSAASTTFGTAALPPLFSWADVEQLGASVLAAIGASGLCEAPGRDFLPLAEDAFLRRLNLLEDAVDSPSPKAPKSR